MAEESYLQSLKTAITTGDVAAKTRMAATWFRSIIERAKAGRDNLDLAPKEWIKYIESI